MVNVVIQCRFGSTRLPAKAMYPLCGIPILSFLIRRLKNGLTQDQYRIIVATTKKTEDNIIAAWAEYEGVYCVRGAEDDVLQRYLTTLDLYNTSTSVRVTADNPFTCPQIIHSCVKLMKKNDLDYVQSQNFPYGAGVDVFSTSLLKKLGNNVSKPEEKEHINLHILNNPEKFKTGNFYAKEPLDRPDLSMTVDTQADFNNLSLILNAYNAPFPWAIKLEQVVKIMGQHPLP